MEKRANSLLVNIWNMFRDDLPEVKNKIGYKK